MLVLKPTGAGKSLFYQLAAVASALTNQQSCAIIISPLIALMQDQVEQLRKCGIKACYVSSLSQFDDGGVSTESAFGGSYHLVYISPKAALARLDLIKKISARIPLVAIDEAHCISSWGYDFNPSYLQLGKLRDAIGVSTPLIAVTATANPRVQTDITNALRLDLSLGVGVIKSTYNRKEIFLQTNKVQSGQDVGLQIGEHISVGCCIVYCMTRDKVESIASDLKSYFKEPVLPYHAGMDTEDRAASLKQWKDDQCRVIVATIAFGMGIDKANVRSVVHWGLPGARCLALE
jgi:ATP-dependent DNA helicase RecQ